MIPLKEDGSLDVELIDQLPVEEHMRVLGEFTSTQMDYYMSKLSDNNGIDSPRNVIVDYGFDDSRSGVDIEEYLQEWRAELDQRK